MEPEPEAPVLEAKFDVEDLARAWEETASIRDGLRSRSALMYRQDEKSVGLANMTTLSDNAKVIYIFTENWNTVQVPCVGIYRSAASCSN